MLVILGILLLMRPLGHQWEWKGCLLLKPRHGASEYWRQPRVTMNVQPRELQPLGGTMAMAATLLAGSTKVQVHGGRHFNVPAHSQSIGPCPS